MIPIFVFSLNDWRITYMRSNLHYKNVCILFRNFLVNYCRVFATKAILIVNIVVLGCKIGTLTKLIKAVK